MTLLEQAKSIITRTKRPASADPELIELAVAFVNGQVTPGQVTKLLGIKSGGLQNFASAYLRCGVRAGLVKVSFIGNGHKENQ